MTAVAPHSGDNDRKSLQCSRRLYAVTMSENNPISETIVKVGVPGSDVTFALDDAESDYISGLVRVDARTGIVSLRTSLDRERTSTISFGVVATEAAESGSRSVTCRVHVTVADVNDNAPVFEFPSPENNTIVLTTGRRYEGKPVARLRARDEDFGTNARVTYSIEAGTPFAVDPTTGLLSVVGNLDSLVAQTANIRVVATDSGNPAMSTTGVLNLVLQHPEMDAPHRGDQTSRRRAADSQTGTGSNSWLMAAIVAVIVAAAVIITAIVAILVVTDRRRRSQKRDLPETTPLPVVGGGNAKHDGKFHGANGDVIKATASVPASAVQKLPEVRILYM